MRKHHHDEEHEEHVNHEAWVIPYADLLTLLMGLFIVLWSISSTDLAKLKAVGASLAEGFGGSPAEAQSQAGAGAAAEGAAAPAADGHPEAAEHGEVGAPPEVAARTEDPAQVAEAFAALDEAAAAEVARAVATRQLDEVERVLTEQVGLAGLGGEVSFRREARGLVVTIVTDDVLFTPGSAQLQGGGAHVLDTVVTALRWVANPVSIEGHTDSRPIATSQFPSNWELSTTRATSVLRYLVDHHGFDPARLTAAGFADQHPLGDNATDAGRALNRRVDVVVLPEPVDVPVH
ncbi:MAG: OmpA family protein [Acidimicrobiia bacterium]|nr:OmpA family protein [Acidimicrobiia bacterium]